MSVHLSSSFYSNHASHILPGIEGEEHADVSPPTDRHILEGLKNIPIMEFPTAYHVIRGILSIENLQYVGSYNWFDHSEPIIVALVFVNLDAYRVPASLLPLFRALADAIANDYPQYALDGPNVDFITDGDTLRTLLWWILDNSSGFRIDTQLAGTHTVLLDSWALRTTEDATLSESYVRGFKCKSTSLPEGLEGTMKHQRIVQFKFGG